jgi:hypothetical protein
MPWSACQSAWSTWPCLRRKKSSASALFLRCHPALSTTALSCAVYHCPILPCLPLPYPALSTTALSCAVYHCPVYHCAVYHCPDYHCPVYHCPVHDCPILPCLPLPCRLCPVYHCPILCCCAFSFHCCTLF